MSTCMHEAEGCRVAEVMEVRDEGGNQHAIRRDLEGCRVAEVMEVRDEGGNQHAIRRDLEGCRVAEVMEVRRWQQLELRRLFAAAAAAQLVEDVVRALILRQAIRGN